jgi:hypothetical protein
MESSQNKNTISIENEIGTKCQWNGYWSRGNCGNIKTNESFQIEDNIVEDNEPKECKQIFKICIFKEKYTEDITKMNYIGPFIVLMMGKMSKGKSSSYEMHYLLC